MTEKDDDMYTTIEDTRETYNEPQEIKQDTKVNTGIGERNINIIEVEEGIIYKVREMWDRIQAIEKKLERQ